MRSVVTALALGPVFAAVISDATARGGLDWMADDMLVLGVPAERIRRLADSWSDGGLWDDIVFLALRTWEAGDDDERRMRWHHLVMAVGNFKRQSGRRLQPAPIAPTRHRVLAGSWDQIRLPDGLLVACDEPASWARLEKSLPGAATATTTTLLAALWPGSHHILDWRVLAAVAGLDAAATGRPSLALATPGSRGHLEPTMERYRDIREVLIGLAGEARIPVQSIERALYLMSRGVRGKGMTWAQYGQALARVLPREQTVGTDGAPDDEQDLPPAAP
jgi:hypothetical protein